MYQMTSKRVHILQLEAKVLFSNPVLMSPGSFADY